MKINLLLRISDTKKDYIKEDKEKNIIIPYIYPYSNILKAFLERKEKNVTILKPVNENIIEDGKQFSRSKEYFSLIALTAEVINKIKDEDEVYTLYLPTDEGGETFAQYGNFIVQKALEVGKELKIDSPFIEDYLDDDSFGVEFFKALVIGDLINQLDDDKQKLYLDKLLKVINKDKINNEEFQKLVKNINNEINLIPNKKKILVVGEALIVYKDYLNNGKLKELKENYTVIKEPLSELLYMTFRDFSNKRNKTNRRYEKLLEEIDKHINYTNLILGNNSPFNKDLLEMQEKLDDKLKFYAGGSGRYRLGKILTAKNVDGILVVSSMYENTATILKILRDKYNDDINIPILIYILIAI